MNSYIATFYSHFGALLYYRALAKQGVAASLAPVPRRISSSCGTCVCYTHTEVIDLAGCELDCVYREEDGVLDCVIKN